MAGDAEFRPIHTGQKDNLADLVSRVAPEDLKDYASFGFIHTQAAFGNRIFLVIEAQGKSASGPRQPKILGAVRVIDFHCNLRNGSTITVENQETKARQEFGHVPVRLFDWPVFVSVPVYQGIKWEAKEQADGRYTRSLVFGMCFKQQSNVKFFNKGNVAVLTPNEYRSHFGDTLPRL